MNTEWFEVSKGRYIKKHTIHKYEIVIVNYNSGTKDNEVSFFVQAGMFDTSIIGAARWEEITDKLTDEFGFRPSLHQVILKCASFYVNDFFGNIQGLEQLNTFLKKYEIEPLVLTIPLNPAITEWTNIQSDRFIRRRVKNGHYEVLKALHFQERTRGSRLGTKPYALHYYEWDIEFFGDRMKPIQDYINEYGYEPKDDVELVLYEVNNLGQGAANELHHFATLNEMNRCLQGVYGVPFVLEKLPIC